MVSNWFNVCLISVLVFKCPRIRLELRSAGNCSIRVGVVLASSNLVLGLGKAVRRVHLLLGGRDYKWLWIKTEGAFLGYGTTPLLSFLGVHRGTGVLAHSQVPGLRWFEGSALRILRMSLDTAAPPDDDA